MSDPYERAKTGRLTFKDGSLATLKTIDKKKHKKNKKKKTKIDEEAQPSDEVAADVSVTEMDGGGETTGEVVYTIDAAKRMKYDELFPVEAKKFGYEPKKVSKSVEEALDDRVKKKADRYCK